MMLISCFCRSSGRNYASASRRCFSSSVRAPAIVGGSGQVGRHMARLLQGLPSCSAVQVLDMQPPPADVPGVFRQLRLGKDSVNTIKSALEGVDCVFSMVTPDVQHGTAAQHHATNHKGIEDLIEACKSAGVPRLVHISSIAVTNHFRASVNGSENDPLPAIEEYISPYDISKRRGEEAVVAANGSALATTVLRAGGVLAGPGDYFMRHALERAGRVISIAGTQPIDFIYAPDLCRAALLAAHKLSSDGADKTKVAGDVFFVSKAKCSDPSELGKRVAKRLGWEHTMLPKGAQSIIALGFRASHQMKVALGREVPGIPPADFMRIPNFEQTFDNSKARSVLGFEPEYTIDDAIEIICDEYIRQQQL